ncbi:MAG: preprotein translocase subunit YajC [Phycisphaeraceae bacterium]|nr:preprotein translocase subunit YajC [Phycisphaeraceae bacterium]
MASMPSNLFPGMVVTLGQTDDSAPPPPPADPSETTGDAETTTTTTTTGDPAAAPANPNAGGGDIWSLLFPIVILFAVFYLFIIRPQSQKDKKHKKLIAAIGKGDRVTTVGGIMGTVVEVRDDVVVIKVDENNNTRLKFSKAAIQSAGNDEDDDKKKD